MPLEFFNVYREQLSSLYQGVALWEPNPIEGAYDQVEIGDVGYVHEGFFYRMFNVTLPSSHPSNNKLGKPDDYTPLDCGPFVNDRNTNFARGDYRSRSVLMEARGYNVANTSMDPNEPDAEGNKYECRGQGALLSLPHDGHRKDTIRTKAFEEYIRENVAGWFAWSQRYQLDVERMEDLILVSGCTLVTSWAAAAFVDPSVKTDICLAAQSFDNGGARFTWSNIHGIVTNHNSHSGPDAPMNQCIFIRGFRAKRVLFWTRPVRAAAEPLPDDPDNYWADEIQVTRVSDAPNYRDPLVAILDYIAENCPQDCAEDTIAIAHDNDLQLIENVENMTASAVETFLREHQIPVLVENGAATLRDGEPPVPDDAKVVFYATVESEGEPVPLAVHPVLSEYLLRLKITGPVDHHYDLPPEDITSLAVHPPMLSLILENYQGYPELIYIRASSGVGVTIEDVLRTVHEELRGPFPRSRLTKLFNVGRYLLNTLFFAGRETNQQGVGSCRFEHLGGRDRLQVLPKHPVEDTAPRGPISSSAESLDEPNPLAAAPSFVDATPHLKSYKTTSRLGSIHRTVLGSLSSHEGIFVASPALRDPGTADSPMQHSPGLSQSPLLQNTKSPSPSTPPLPNVGFSSPNHSPQSRVEIPSSVPRPDSPLIATPGTNQMPTRGNEDRPSFTSAVQGELSDDFSPKGSTHPSLPDGEVDSLKKENQVHFPGLKKNGQVDDLTKNGAAMKRRALLIGITYANARLWSPLEGPHEDVDRYRELLVSTYDYRPEDVVVLKDDPALPEHSQPTRVNVIRELKALVSDATPGDRFTLLYTGHSDQQEATTDLEEEDGMDEMLITSDEQSIIDNELREILVPPLPVGCSLLAVLDTCHSGSMLDLPHHHCNSVYVPWQSKGERRTMTMQNINVRSLETDIVESTSGERLSTESVIESSQSAELPSLLQVNTTLGETHLASQREMSPTSPGGQSRGRGVRMARDRERMMFTQTRYASPERRFVCDGWCKYSKFLHPNVLSLSACSDLQRAWEGPNGSLTTILCNYLKENNSPSYGALMSHINFQLHYNALVLHEYTLEQRKKARHGQGDGFDGELDNFQEPELSSLVRLNMDDTLQL